MTSLPGEQPRPSAPPADVDAICDVFEAAWYAGQEPRVENRKRDRSVPALVTVSTSAGPVVLEAHGRIGDDERVMERVLVKAHHHRELETTQPLNVEDLLHGALELQHSADAAPPAGGEIHHRHATLQLLASRRQGHAVHR